MSRLRLRALGRLYLERRALHVNANILIASLSGTAATAIVSAQLGGRGWGPDAVAAAGTITTALVFVPVQLALHFLVVSLQARARGEAEAEVGARFWRESRLIWATGIPAIAAFLVLFAIGQATMLRLGLRPVAATITAYVAAQVAGRVIHTLLLRMTSLGEAAATRKRADHP